MIDLHKHLGKRWTRPMILFVFLGAISIPLLLTFAPRHFHTPLHMEAADVILSRFSAPKSENAKKAHARYYQVDFTLTNHGTSALDVDHYTFYYESADPDVVVDILQDEVPSYSNLYNPPVIPAGVGMRIHHDLRISDYEDEMALFPLKLYYDGPEQTLLLAEIDSW